MSIPSLGSYVSSYFVTPPGQTAPAGLRSFEGSIFFYPQSAAFLKAYDPSSRENVDRHCMGGIPELFRSQDPYILCMQVWVYNDENDDWANHEYLQEETHSRDRFPSYLPAYLFQGKKDDDIIEFSINNNTFKLTCAQESSRYSKSFEETFTLAIKNLWEDLKSIENKRELNERESIQLALLLKNF